MPSEMSTAINFERLDAAITHGYEHPEEFSMATWFRRWSCGSTACLAGTGAMQAGWQPDFPDPRFADYDGVVTGFVKRGEERSHAEEVGADLFGLDDEQREIFSVDDIHHVIEYRNRWAREAGVPERAWGSQ